MSPRTSVSPGLSWYHGSSDLCSCWATKDCAKTLRNNDYVIQEPWLKKIRGLCSKYSLMPLSWEEMLTAACFPWHWTSSRCVLSCVPVHGVCWLPALLCSHGRRRRRGNIPLAVPGQLPQRGHIPVSSLLGIPRAGRVGKREQRNQGESWGLQKLWGISSQEETTEAVKCLHPPELGNMVIATGLMFIILFLPCEFNPRYL